MQIRLDLKLYDNQPNALKSFVLHNEVRILIEIIETIKATTIPTNNRITSSKV